MNTRFRALALILAASWQATAWADAPIASREQLNAVAWMQRADEYTADALQSYRLAIGKLAQAKAQKTTTASVEQARRGGFKSKKPAVVLDVDETVLNNLPYNATLVRDGRAYDAAEWDKWVAAQQAEAIPGAREFLAQARAKGFKPIFITNRSCNQAGGYDAQGRALDCPQKAATIGNLEKVLGFRPAPEDVLLRNEVDGRDDSDKQARREEVAKTYRIAMLMGDDLNDFIRRADYAADTHAHLWGEQWFVMSNPVYGSWQSAMPTVEQKYAALKTWNAPLPSSGKALNNVAWNMEWLADPAVLDRADFWGQCAAQNFPNKKLRDDLPFCDVYKKNGITTAAEYERKKLSALRSRLAELSAQQVDVLGVVEVQGPGALQAVLPAGYRVACFTTRVDAQNVGFAVREAASLALNCREITALSLEGVAGVDRPVRSGLELTVGAGDQSVTLLNVHLKSSCPSGPMDSASNAACRSLQHQAQPLEAWIEEQATAGRRFMIVGDWNRDLEAEVKGQFAARNDGSNPVTPIPSAAVIKNLWPEINDLAPATSAMALAAMDRSASAGRACFNNLDQVATSLTLLSRLDPASLDAGKQPATMLSRPAEASDHCPVQIQLRWR